MEVKKRKGIGGWRSKRREKSLNKRRRKSSVETIKIK